MRRGNPIAWLVFGIFIAFGLWGFTQVHGWGFVLPTVPLALAAGMLALNRHLSRPHAGTGG